MFVNYSLIFIFDLVRQSMQNLGPINNLLCHIRSEAKLKP